MEEEKEILIEEQDLRLLKTILSEPLAASEFANTYNEELFIGDAKLFAKDVINYVKAYKAPPTKRVLLDHAGSSEMVQIIEHIYSEFENVEVTPAEFKYDLDKMKNRFTYNKIVNLKNILDDPPSDLALTVKLIQSQMEAVKQVQQSRKQAYVQRSLKNYLPDFKRNYNEKFKNKDLGRGILTGYSFLDYVKNGLMPAELLIVAGESGSGKSMFLNNIAIQMWMQKNTVYSSDFMKGYNVLYFSLEMPFDACFRRTMARVADIPMYSIRDASLNPLQVSAMKRAVDFIDRYPYEFEIVDIPRGVTVDQIEARFQEAMTRYNPDVVVVDYLGLLEDADADGDDWLKLGYIAGKLHEFARVYGIVVLTAVQLNRISNKNSISSAEKIGLHRIGRSSLIMHHANIGIQLETRPNEKDFSYIPYHVIKNRDGELGDHILIKNFKNASLTDSDPPFEPKEEIGVSEETNPDDISNLLEQYNWGKSGI